MAAVKRKPQGKVVEMAGAEAEERRGSAKSVYPESKKAAAFRKRLQEEQFGWLPSDDELKAAIAKIINAVEHYSALIECLPLEFPLGRDGASNVFKLQLEDSEIVTLAETLDPTIPRRKERAAALLGNMERLICEHREESLAYESQVYDDYESFGFDMLDAGFYIGVFMGAKIAGYSHEQLEQLGRNLHRTITAQPRYGFTARNKNGKGGSHA